MNQQQQEEDEIDNCSSIDIVIPPKPNDKFGKAYKVNLNQFLSLSKRPKDEDIASSKLPFVWKLYEMLQDVAESGNVDVVSWVAQGKAFKVHDMDRFVKEIIPIYFKQSKYKSFQRQLYFYNFVRVTKGTDEGAYSHPQFVRGRPTSYMAMAPKKKKRSSSTRQKTVKESAKAPNATIRTERTPSAPTHEEDDHPDVPMPRATRSITSDIQHQHIELVRRQSSISELNHQQQQRGVAARNQGSHQVAPQIRVPSGDQIMTQQLGNDANGAASPIFDDMAFHFVDNHSTW